MSWSYLFTRSKIPDRCCGISHPHTPSSCLCPLASIPITTKNPGTSCHFIYFRTIHRSSFVSVPSSAHTSPTSSFLLPLSFIWLDNFQELCNPSFAISFNNLIKVGFCLTFRLACFTKWQRFAFWCWSLLPAGPLTPSSIPSSPMAPCPADPREPRSAPRGGQGSLAAAGSRGDSRPSWLRGHRPSCLCWAGEREPLQERLIPPGSRRAGRCAASGNNDARQPKASVPLDRRGAEPARGGQRSGWGRCSRPVQLKGPGSTLGIGSLLFLDLSFQPFSKAG